MGGKPKGQEEASKHEMQMPASGLTDWPPHPCVSCWCSGFVLGCLLAGWLADSATRHRLNVTCLVLWVLMTALFYAFAALSGAASRSSGYVGLGLALLLVNGLGVYSLVTEVTPITTHMLQRAPLGLQLPVSWHTPTTATVAQVPPTI